MKMNSSAHANAHAHAEKIIILTINVASLLVYTLFYWGKTINIYVYISVQKTVL